MNVIIRNKSLMMIFLLEECNFNCPHCVRIEEPMARGYKLTSEQLQACLHDCSRLKAIEWVHFSGGEPTLWNEDGKDLVDLLLAISDEGLIPGFTTNGSPFENYAACERFFTRYLTASSMPLRLYLSIDTFHCNFEPGTGRAPSLDNVLRYKQSLPENQASRLETHVLVTISKLPSSLLPEEMVDYYESLGADFCFVPLARRGRAKKLGDICPVPGSDDPKDLGAYARFHSKDVTGPATEVRQGEKAENLILIGDAYYVSQQAGDRVARTWIRVGRLGTLPDTIVGQYSNQSG
jgi:MoaA/NifB/PqqE/SkfB family radical SAM enzyme